jgi:signal transduction histidine kinase
MHNAVKFVPEGVVPQITVGTDRRHSHIRIWIEDNGIGISGEDTDRIWEAFQRLDRSRPGGVGIGLSIVRRAAERMGGSAGVESSQARGSLFWMELPSAE